MPTVDLPSSLDSAALARRLAELAGDERDVQVDFLLHLDEFDRRRAYLEEGHRSLWEYCLRVLHLREGAAGRRIGAMRVLRRFPALEPVLRDGRLCASTAALLGPVLTDENLSDLVGRAAYRTKAEVEELVVTLRPRPAPQEGVRRLPAAPPASLLAPADAQQPPSESPPLLVLAPAAPTVAAPEVLPAPTPTTPPAPARVQPVAEDRWSVRVTLDAEAKADLETLRALLSHKIPSGEIGAVLREAIRCGIEKHGLRKGASAPAQTRRRVGGRPARSAPESTQSPSHYVPAEVRREVWKRDGGRCTFVGPDGCRCESRWQLEFDHIVPVALGGRSVVENVRLRCRGHNLLHAERVYGREHMDRYRRTERTIAGDSSSTG